MRIYSSLSATIFCDTVLVLVNCPHGECIPKIVKFGECFLSCNIIWTSYYGDDAYVFYAGRQY